MKSQLKNKTFVNKGFFITVEGGEGVGKSSFMAALSKALQDRFIPLVTTREPGGTPIAEKLRDIFNNPVLEEAFCVEAEFMLISAARAQHVLHKIKPALTSEKWVLCDRFIDSSIVYQGFVGGLNLDFMEKVNHQCTFGISPDVTFLLDCPFEVSASRVKARNESSLTSTRYDALGSGFHLKVRQSFLDLAEKHKNRFVVLDAQKSLDNLIKDAISKLKELSHFP